MLTDAEETAFKKITAERDDAMRERDECERHHNREMDRQSRELCDRINILTSEGTQLRRDLADARRELHECRLSLNAALTERDTALRDLAAARKRIDRQEQAYVDRLLAERDDARREFDRLREALVKARSYVAAVFHYKEYAEAAKRAVGQLTAALQTIDAALAPLADAKETAIASDKGEPKRSRPIDWNVVCGVEFIGPHGSIWGCTREKQHAGRHEFDNGVHPLVFDEDGAQEEHGKAGK